ncbi:uncharacterized protein [Neodiprion pinetum]|uniref:uncharacterized protein isoform X1 n=1 Tax=Neodiprion pinetum TaxID=441929 RepID=UPI003718FE42
MKKILGYFLLVCAIVPKCTTEVAEEYLTRKQREIKVAIAKSYIKDPLPVDVRSYKIEWNNLWGKYLDSDNALALNFLDETFVLANDRVLRVEMDVSQSVMLRQVTSISQQKPAKFVRSIAYKKLFYLLICQVDGSCSLHVGPNVNDLRFCQIIKHRGLPMDAKFFTQINQLYLVVADNSGQFAVPSVIYRWTGTYMDVIAEVSTTGAIAVTTMNYKHFTIVIFAQNVKGWPRIGTEVFKFKNGAVERIQFLATDGPTSIHHYKHDTEMFLLVINELSASKVFWWDGKEFLTWIELPEIKSPTKVNVVYADGETLLLVAQQNTFSLYKIMNLAYTKLDLLETKDRHLITDFNARVQGKTIILVLVTKSEGKLCRVEPYKLVIKKYHRDITDKVDGTLEYLKQLKDLLKKRMPAVELAYNSWPSLLPFSESIVVSSPLDFNELIMDSGSIVNLLLEAPANILTPTELAIGLAEMELVADFLLKSSTEFIYSNTIAEIEGTIVVEGDAYLDEMHLDSLTVSILNNQKVELDDVFSYTRDQNFSAPLRGSSITIENLEIASICGIPFANWLTTNNPNQTAIDFFSDSVKILKDKIIVQSDLILDNIGVSRLNNLDLESFVDDLFIIGLNQEIRGSIFYKRGLDVYSLTMNATYGINANRLLTKSTDQILDGEFYMKNLQVDDLVVERINNVDVNEAARISKENVISGHVTFRNLRVTEELFVADGVSVNFDVRPIQMYEDVEINGDLSIRDLKLNPSCSLYLKGEKVDLDYLFKNYWTKSTDQMIPNDVKLTGGITIDDLRSDYLNGYREDDFLYTTATEIPKKFGPLHFKKFEIDGAIVVEGGEELPIDSVLVTDDVLFVNQKIYIKNLTVANLNAESYNKIPIDFIMSGNIGAKITGKIKYKNLVVRNGISVNELWADFFNGINLRNFFNEVMYVDKSYEMDYLEIDQLETENFAVVEMNNLKMSDFEKMLKYKDVTSIKNITVDGDLIVTGNLKVDFVNGMTCENFITKLSTDYVELKGQSIFENFVVFGDLNANLLDNIKVEDLVANALSKTKCQTISGKFKFEKIEASYLKAHTINGVNVTNLALVTDPLIIEGDITFSNLLVKGDIITGYLNNLDVREIYENALLIPYNRIAQLTVDGSISWEKSLPKLESMSYLFDKAVTKNTNQIITGEVVFAENVRAFRLTSSKIIGGIDIASIVLDAVIPDGKPIAIKGEKYFAKGLTVGELKVSGNIGIRKVNDWDILALNSSIVRKFDTETVTGHTIFRNEVKIEHLDVTGKVHGLPTHGIATVNYTLPSNTKFLHLQVQSELRVGKIDGVDIDTFIKNRVTLDGNHDVYCDVIFRDAVFVTQNANLPSINGIRISDVVLSDSSETQLISGEKVFVKDLSVHGRVNVGLINEIPVTHEYENGIFNNVDTLIDGNIIFAADFETHSDISVSDLVNGIKLTDLSGEITSEVNTMIKNLETGQSYIDKIIDRSINATASMPDIFFYLDVDQELVIRAPNIRKIQTVSVESMTKLNLYGVEQGRHCGLPDSCLCPAQYVAELLDYECKIWKIDGARTVYNFHELESRFGMIIVSNVTSSGPHCTHENHAAEITTVSWMTSEKMPTGQIKGHVEAERLEIGGYLSDAKTFMIGEKFYVVLAIYYDAFVKSHEVNSLVYEINLSSGEITLVQKIRTSGAIALDIFATKRHGIHLLIACAQRPAESQIHRFKIRKSKFELLRSFRTGGSQNVKSLILENEYFVLLDDPLANSVHIFYYNRIFDNYYFYQSLFHQSLVKTIEVFYSGASGTSDAFVIVTTEEGRFFVYEYMYYGGFQLRIQQWFDGVQTMTQFNYSQRRYIFVGATTNSTVYKIVQQGPVNNL